MDQYFGTYQTFETVSKKDAAVLLGADNLVGDRYTIEIELDSDVHKAWLVSRFDQRIGFFDGNFSRRLSILKANGLELTAILSFVAYTDMPEPGHYWGEMAVIAYNPAHKEAFERFITTVCTRMFDNVRTRVNFDAEGVERIISSDGSWVPEQTVPMPSKKKGTVIMKSKRSVSEKLIEQGRKGNKGCYVVSWAFIIALVAALLFGLKACGVF